MINTKFDDIPVELKALNQWVVWRAVPKTNSKGEKKLDKRPLQAKNPSLDARTKNSPDKLYDGPASSTWATFDEACRALVDYPTLNGIGFVFSKDDPYCGIDLDHCVNGHGIAPWAKEILDTFRSYSEKSQSGTGGHTIIKASLPKGRRRNGPIEIYNEGRFFVMTGNRIDGYPGTIETRQKEAEALVMKLGPSPEPSTPSPERTSALPDTLDDAALLQRAREARNGIKFSTLYDHGDITEYSSHSEADLALCSILAFWTKGNEARIDSLFRRSALYREKWDREDYRASTLALAVKALAPNKEPLTGKKKILITVDIEKVVNAAEDALLEGLTGTNKIFQRGRALVRLARDGKPSTFDPTRPAGTPIITGMPMAALSEAMASTADWFKLSRNKQLQAMPPKWAAETLTARASWRFPYLEAIIEAPTLRADGTILDEPGYDEASCLLYVPNVNYPPIPENPTIDEAKVALAHLMEPFTDFPFCSESDRSATLAAVLTVIVRTAINGNVPMFIIKAPEKGTGKTLSCDVIATIATGRDAPKTSQASDDAEETKCLVSLCLAGDRMVLIDNVERPLGNGTLAKAITARTIKDRLLGTNIQPELPMIATFFATGNNLIIQGDMGRRILPISMDAQCENPETRKNFLHQNLLQWVSEHRGEFVTDALTILRAFIVAGKPPQSLDTWGSFEAWSDLIRSSLVWCGAVDPCLGRLKFRDEADTERMDLTALLTAWETTIGDTEVTLTKLLTIAKEHSSPDLKDALTAIYPAKGEMQATPLGNALRKYKGKVAKEKRLVTIRKASGKAIWKLEYL